MVEHATENRSVGGSIPPLGTSVEFMHRQLKLPKISNFEKMKIYSHFMLNILLIFNINTGSKVAITKEENKSDSLINLGKYIVGTI